MTERGDGQYDVDVRWTTHGVAHVRADDWGSLGFGQGYACARDHLPTMADQYTKVRSERALHHGPGPDGAHVASDLGYLALGVGQRAPDLRDAQPPHIRALATGYTAGYNAWLAEADASGDALPDWCRTASWIHPIDEMDLWRYFVDISLLASGRNLAEVIGRAEAPGPAGPAEPSPLGALGGGSGASNGWAFGGDATASGHGMVVANPHFPWGGEARFWECHLTLPGEIDAYGVSLLGTPGVQMGFNDQIAWCHTFSRGHRFTLARLDLVAGDPTSYRYGDEERSMTSTEHVVSVRGEDGVDQLRRTMWRSHHGPMVNLPLLGWGLDVGFTYRDANLDNDQILGQFLAMSTARSMDDLQASYADLQGMPWVNTLAADRTGRAWFIDGSATPNLSAAAEERFVQRLETDGLAALLHENRVALLDGSDPDDDWVDSPDARSPGVLPHDRLPQMERRDYVLNANDSHWLNHATETLEGYSPLHGLERTPRSLRTRQNLRTASRLAATGDLTIERAVEVLLANDSLSAELLRDGVVARGAAAGGEAARAAAVLADWDGRFDLDSIGAPLWREFMGSFDPAHHRDAGPLFALAFDPEDPVSTPAALAPPPAEGPDPVVDALCRAVQLLDEAGLSVDARLGDAQWVQRGARRVPVHGGYEGDGVLNILAPVGALSSQALEPQPPPLAPVGDRAATTGLAAGGYRATYGTSFVMAVELTDDGPVGIGLLAYGQSGDSRSPHHVDGTEAFAAKDTRPLLFHDADIAADPNLVQVRLRG